MATVCLLETGSMQPHPASRPGFFNFPAYFSRIAAGVFCCGFDLFFGNELFDRRRGSPGWRLISGISTRPGLERCSQLERLLGESGRFWVFGWNDGLMTEMFRVLLIGSYAVMFWLWFGKKMGLRCRAASQSRLNF